MNTVSYSNSIAESECMKTRCMSNMQRAATTNMRFQQILYREKPQQIK